MIDTKPMADQCAAAQCAVYSRLTDLAHAEDGRGWLRLASGRFGPDEIHGEAGGGAGRGFGGCGCGFAPTDHLLPLLQAWHRYVGAWSGVTSDMSLVQQDA